MNNIGVCEFCKYVGKDIAEIPCLHCLANLGSFEFDLTEHDMKVRNNAIDEVLDYYKSNYEIMKRQENGKEPWIYVRNIINRIENIKIKSEEICRK